MHSPYPCRWMWWSIALAISLSIVSTGIAFAEETEEEERKLEIGRWYPTLETGVNLTQSSYTENWAGGLV